MAEEPIVNGVNSVDEVVSDDQTVEIEKKSKLEALEQENEESNEKIKLLIDEIEGLKTDRVELKKKLDEKKTEIDEFESDKRALQAISSRAAELEMEVSRLQHDLISTMTENEEVSKELREVKSVVEELKVSEKEKVDLIERIEGEKAENEKKLQELEEKVSGFESVISEKESEILVLKKEKKEKEGETAYLENVLKISETKVGKLEAKVAVLESKLEELTSKNLMNGAAVEREIEIERESTEKGLKGLKLQWPVALASTGTIAVVAAAVYIGYSRRR